MMVDNCFYMTLKLSSLRYTLFYFSSEKAFFINTLKLLRPGGVTLHTTELMLSHLDEVTSGHTSIWRYKDLVDVHNKALELGFEVFPIDVRIGEQQVHTWVHTCCVSVYT